MDIHNSEISILKNEQKNWINASYIIVIIIILLVIVCHYLKYTTFLITSGQVIVENNNITVGSYIKIDDLNYITTNNIVHIKEKSYQYKIEYISPEIFQNNYKEIKFRIELNEEEKINNNIIELKFIKENKEIIKYIKNYI